MNPERIILASKSPRRKEIMELCGYNPVIMVSECDESQVIEKDPKKLVEKLSCLKAKAVSEKCKNNDMIIAADTIVVRDKTILGKPKTKKEAFEMIRSLSGRDHDVYTGVTLIYKKKSGNKIISFVDRTSVTVSPMTNCQIHAYVDTGEPMDKAGGYGIQGSFGKFIPSIKGDYYSVMGLPMAKTYEAIRELT